MINIVKKGLEDRYIGILEVKYSNNWNIDKFDKFLNNELNKIKNSSYDRESVFRNDPYFRYFRKYKKTYPVMMQVESFILKNREFRRDNYLNCIPFLSELKSHILLGSHDVSKIEGDLILYSSNDKEVFMGMGDREAHAYPGDVTGRDDKGIILSLISGADNRTCLNDNSRHILYFIFGVPGISKEDITSVKEELVSYINVLDNDAKCEFNIF